MITSMPRRPRSRRSQRRNLRVLPTPPNVVNAEIAVSQGDDVAGDLAIPLATAEAESEQEVVVKVTPLTLVPPPTGGTVQPKSATGRGRRASKPPSWWQKSLLGCVRVGIFGIGLGAIAGTALTTLSPTKFIQNEPAVSTEAPGAKALQEGEEKPVIYPQQLLASLTGWVVAETDKLKGSAASATGEQNPTPTSHTPETSTISPTQADQALQAKLATLAASKAPAIVPYAYFLDVDNGQFANQKGETKLPAASTIKIPVAIAFFEAVDQGKIKLHEQLPLTKDVIVGEAGTMQYDVGKRSTYPALEVVTKMIVISDNTATNMLIKRLGGKEFLNQRFQAWQMPQTQISNYLPDLEGTNTTSAQDLAFLLAKLQQGQILSLKSRDRLLDIMQETKTRTLLPQGLEAGATISHKTGDIGKILGDAGIIDMPNGKRYVGAVLATRPHNDPAGRALIQDISRTVYQHYKGITPAPTPTTKAAAKPPAAAKKTTP